MRTRRSEEEPCNFASCNYCWSDLSIDRAASSYPIMNWIDTTDREAVNHWIAGHYGCLDSPLAETRLNRECRVTCKACGAADVEIAMWVRQDTMEPVDDYGSFGEYDTTWCHQCEEHEGVEERWHYG